MSFISFEFNWNHIYFLLHFLTYLIRHFIGNTINYDNRKQYEIVIFVLYIFTLSNFFSFFFLFDCQNKNKKNKKYK